MTLHSLKHYLAISLCLFVLPVAVQSASAHRVNVFAWVDGDTIHVESKFSGGKKVKTGKVVVRVPLEVGTFLLNEKRDAITAIEQRHEVGRVAAADVTARVGQAIAADLGAGR